MGAWEWPCRKTGHINPYCCPQGTSRKGHSYGPVFPRETGELENSSAF